MKSFAVQKIPFGLSLTALLATFIALQVFDRITDAVDIPASAFFSVPLVASITAFLFSELLSAYCGDTHRHGFYIWRVPRTALWRNYRVLDGEASG